MDYPICDLHCHSRCSDGSDTPGELILLAERAGLSALALTDHNTTAGLPEFLAAAEKSSVRPIPGVEFSTDYGVTELHILALFLRPEHEAAIGEVLAEARRLKVLSNLELTRNLQNAGIPIDYEAVCARTDGIPNRATFAAELIHLGYADSIKSAIHTLLSPKNGLYAPPKHPDALQTISMIRSLGAVPILAHPFLNLKEPALREFLPKGIAHGLVGMETLYTDFTPELTTRARQVAAEFGLLESGGSDYHGSNKPHIPMGGGLSVPMALLEKLEDFAR